MNKTTKLLSDYLLNPKVVDNYLISKVRIILVINDNAVSVDVTDEIKDALLTDINALCD